MACLTPELLVLVLEGTTGWPPRDQLGPQPLVLFTKVRELLLEGGVVSSVDGGGLLVCGRDRDLPQPLGDPLENPLVKGGSLEHPLDRDQRGTAGQRAEAPNLGSRRRLLLGLGVVLIRGGR